LLLDLKGQCHEMMIEMSPWSSSVGLNYNGRGPFFSLKIARHTATNLRYSRASIDVKTGSPDPAYFATTRPLIRRLWQFAHWLERPLAYRSRHSAICQGTLPDMPQPADFGGFVIRPDPAVTARYAHGRPNHCANCQHSPMD
jgi:hypothetical protein